MSPTATPPPEDASHPVVPSHPSASSYLAAVDLGSNSFHMLIAREVNGVPAVIDRLRERVQLAGGLDAKGRLSREAQERAIACLGRFGQRIRHIPEGRVRAVGTNTLRAARRVRKFQHAAETALGHEIEVIPGVEEARLIYLGVAHDLSDDTGPRLVIDIGGGSTECVLGERFEVIEAHSLYMGCVSFTRRFFPDGQIKRRMMDEAILAARAEIQTLERRFRALGWDRAVGASGTIRATVRVLRENGWSDQGITALGLRKLRKALLSAGHLDAVALTGLGPDRAAVFPGGVAILVALFEALGIESLEASAGALREGVLYDLLGRIRHEDVRERTIRAFQQRYHVDRRQAARVERNALDFLRQAAVGWEIDPVAAGRFLTWAARLHEIGLAITYGLHQQHGAYLLANTDMPGFSRDDQMLLAAIVGGHRRKISRRTFRGLSRARRRLALRLIVLLRLAVLTNRERGPHPLPPFELHGLPDGLALTVPSAWREKNPLMHRDFESETEYLKRVGVRLVVES